MEAMILFKPWEDEHFNVKQNLETKATQWHNHSFHNISVDATTVKTREVTITRCLNIKTQILPQ